MGEIQVAGEEALDFLSFVLTNDISRLKEGYSFYSVICNQQGFCLEDCFVSRISDELFLLVVNAGNRQKIFHWLRKQGASYNVEIQDLSVKLGKLDLQGPLAQSLLEDYLELPCDEKDWPRFSFKNVLIKDVNHMISRTGYTGEDGFEFYVPAGFAPVLWEALLVLGREKGLRPAGLGARDSLRLEAGYSLYGHELDESVTPVEAGLGWVVRDRPGDFSGKEVLLAQKEGGVAKKLTAFEMVDKGVPRQNYKVFLDNKEVGRITSGGYGPTLDKQIGLAFISGAMVKPGQSIDIDIRGRKKKAVVVTRPFYPYRGGK